MTTVDRHRRLDRRSDRLGLGAVARRAEVDLGRVQLLDRLPAGLHQEVGEVVEVPVEDRALEPRPLHDHADAELSVGELAHQLGRRRHDPGAGFLAAQAGSGLSGGDAHLIGLAAQLTQCDTWCNVPPRQANLGGGARRMEAHTAKARRRSLAMALGALAAPGRRRGPRRHGAPGRRRHRRPPEHPRRDDRRHGEHRPPVHAERAPPARQAGDQVHGRGRLLPALLPGAGHLHHRSVRAQPRRRRQLLSVRLVRDEEPRQHPPRMAPEGRVPHRADRQVAERLRGARCPRRGAQGVRHLARTARRLRLRLLQLRDEPQRQAAELGRRELRAQARRSSRTSR